MNDYLLKSLAFDEEMNFDQKMKSLISEIESNRDSNDFKPRLKE